MRATASVGASSDREAEATCRSQPEFLARRRDKVSGRPMPLRKQWQELERELQRLASRSADEKRPADEAPWADSDGLVVGAGFGFPQDAVDGGDGLVEKKWPDIRNGRALQARSCGRLMYE